MFSAIPLFSCLSSFLLFSIAISLKSSRVYIFLIEFVGFNKKLRGDAFLLFSKRFCLSDVFQGCSMNINIMNTTFDAVVNSRFYVFAMKNLKWFVWYLNFFPPIGNLKTDIDPPIDLFKNWYLLHFHHRKILSLCFCWHRIVSWKVSNVVDVLFYLSELFVQ